MLESNVLNNKSFFSYDHLVYLRVFEGCNLDCLHCFIPSNPKKINLDLFKNSNITQELISKGGVLKGQTVYLQWHGGEPTLVGSKYIRKAINLIEADKSIIYRHGIQTNLMNYGENRKEWRDLYKEYFDSILGVSWDIDLRRVRDASLKEEDKIDRFNTIFWQNVKLAQEDGLTLYFVITVTKLFFEKFKNPFDFFDLLVSKGIRYVNLERITKTGYARINWDRIGLSNAEYSEGMRKLFKYYYLYKKRNLGVDLNISPFDGLFDSVKGLMEDKEVKKKVNSVDMLNFSNQNGYGCWSGKCDTTFHTIDNKGYRVGCTAINSENTNKNKMFKDEKYQVINLHSIKNISAERIKRKEDCVDCEFNLICSSGCLSVEKFDNSGECSGSKRLFNEIKKTLSLDGVSL